MDRFKDKVIIITGAASGIGEATTRRMAAEGGKVVIADYSEERADKLADELNRSGADVRSLYFSATDRQSCKNLIEFTRKEYNRIDILVNNVGGTDLRRDKDVEKLDIDYFEDAFRLNLACTLYLSQLVIPIMESQGGGNIVNVASVSGQTGDNQGTLYGTSKAGVTALTKYIATKHGLVGLTKHVAFCYKEWNIRCNAVAPGLVLTPAALNNLDEKVRNVFLSQCVTPYLGQPEDIAAVITFLASEESRYITGQTLVADGGLTIHNPTVKLEK